MQKIVESLALLGKMGLTTICGDNIQRLFILFLNILASDYEEQYVTAESIKNIKIDY